MTLVTRIFCWAASVLSGTQLFLGDTEPNKSCRKMTGLQAKTTFGV